MAPSDETLFEKIRSGDMESFDALYSRYERRLFGFILRYVRRSEEAEEIFHETFMEVLEDRDLRFDHAALSTWLYQIARNKCLNRLRSKGREAQFMVKLESEFAAMKLNETSPSLEQNQVYQALEKAVSGLSMPLAEVYHLRSSGLSYEAMATVLKVPLGTIKSRLHETVSQLRKEMEQWFAEQPNWNL